MYTIKWTTKYPGGHANDPGYRVTRVRSGQRVFSVTSKPDGSDISRISAWSGNGRLTNLSASNRAKRAPAIEEAIRSWVAQSGEV